MLEWWIEPVWLPRWVALVFAVTVLLSCRMLAQASLRQIARDIKRREAERE